jgi:hypothetical protein
MKYYTRILYINIINGNIATHIQTQILCRLSLPILPVVSVTHLTILHQPLIDAARMVFAIFDPKSVRESCIRVPQTRRTPLQTHTLFMPILLKYIALITHRHH